MLSALGAERSNRWPLVAARIPESASIYRVCVCMYAAHDVFTARSASNGIESP